MATGETEHYLWLGSLTSPGTPWQNVRLHPGMVLRAEQTWQHSGTTVSIPYAQAFLVVSLGVVNSRRMHVLPDGDGVLAVDVSTCTGQVVVEAEGYSSGASYRPVWGPLQASWCSWRYCAMSRVRSCLGRRMKALRSLRSCQRKGGEADAVQHNSLHIHCNTWPGLSQLLVKDRVNVCRPCPIS